MIDKKLIVKMYREEEKGLKEIADYFHVSKQRIHQIIANYSTLGKSSKKLLLLKPNCEICNKPSKVIHHKNKNTKDNSKKNLQFLCLSCHNKKHTKPIETIQENPEKFTIDYFKKTGREGGKKHNAKQSTETIKKKYGKDFFKNIAKKKGKKRGKKL